MSENIGSSKRKRKVLSATLAVAMTATMLLSGTLAYYYRSAAVNVFKGMSEGRKVVGHDDFDPETGNKDIYMENLGAAPVYVRIRLSEDFQISEKGGSTEQMSFHTSDSSTTQTKSYNEVEMENGAFRGAHIHGLCTDETDLATDGFAAADDPGFHETYFAWTMGGATSRKAFLSAASDEYTTNPTDLKYKDEDEPATEGEQGTIRVVYDTKNEKGTYTFTDTDSNGINDGENIAIKQTPEQDEIISLTEWKALTLERKLSYTGWVLDDTKGISVDEQGWFYWSQPLMGGQATGLLLDHVKTLEELTSGEYSYEYHIHVDFDAVDETDKGLWLRNFTDSHSGDQWVGLSPASTVAYNLVNFISDRAQYGNKQDDLVAALNAMEEAYRQKETNHEFYSFTARSFVQSALTKIAEGDMEAALALKEQAEAEETAYTNLSEPEKEALKAPLPVASAVGTVEEGKLDVKLHEYLLTAGYDVDGDDAISKEEARAISTISINPTYSPQESSGIKSLNGVTNENFPNLKALVIRGADIETVNVEALPKKITRLNLNFTPIAEFDIGSLTTDLDSLSLCGTNISTIANYNEKKINIKALDIRYTKITSWKVSSDIEQLLCGGTEGKDASGKPPWLGKTVSGVDGVLDLSEAKNLTRFSLAKNVLKKLDVTRLEKIKGVTELYELGAVEMIIKREDQTIQLNIGVPADKIYTRKADGKLYNSAGQVCNEDGTPVTTP